MADWVLYNIDFGQPPQPNKHTRYAWAIQLPPILLSSCHKSLRLFHFLCMENKNNNVAFIISIIYGNLLSQSRKKLPQWKVYIFNPCAQINEYTLSLLLFFFARSHIRFMCHYACFIHFILLYRHVDRKIDIKKFQWGFHCVVSLLFVHTFCAYVWVCVRVYACVVWWRIKKFNRTI